MLEDHGDDVRAIAFSPDGSKLASASSDCLINIWYVSDVSDHLQNKVIVIAFFAWLPSFVSHERTSL